MYSDVSTTPCTRLHIGNTNISFYKQNHWHKATNQLRGTDLYGRSGSDSSQWSIEFETAAPGYNEFLVATGDKEIWLMATKSQVIGYYSNMQRIIM